MLFLSGNILECSSWLVRKGLAAAFHDVSAACPRARSSKWHTLIGHRELYQADFLIVRTTAASITKLVSLVESKQRWHGAFTFSSVPV